jgi:hypothetical protein
MTTLHDFQLYHGRNQNNTTTLDKIVHYPRHQRDVTLKSDCPLSISQPTLVCTFFLRVWTGTNDKSERPSMEIVLQTFHRTSSNRPYRSISGLSICNKKICITFYVVLSQTIMSVRFTYRINRVVVHPPKLSIPMELYVFKITNIMYQVGLLITFNSYNRKSVITYCVNFYIFDTDTEIKQFISSVC